MSRDTDSDILKNVVVIGYLGVEQEPNPVLPSYVDYGELHGHIGQEVNGWNECFDCTNMVGEEKVLLGSYYFKVINGMCFAVGAINSAEYAGEGEVWLEIFGVDADKFKVLQDVYKIEKAHSSNNEKTDWLERYYINPTAPDISELPYAGEFESLKLFSKDFRGDDNPKVYPMKAVQQTL